MKIQNLQNLFKGPTRNHVAIYGGGRGSANRVSQVAKSLKSQSFRPETHSFDQVKLKNGKNLNINAYLNLTWSNEWDTGRKLWLFKLLATWDTLLLGRPMHRWPSFHNTGHKRNVDTRNHATFLYEPRYNGLSTMHTKNVQLLLGFRFFPDLLKSIDADHHADPGKLNFIKICWEM